MAIELAFTVIGFALIDSTTLGTSLIPIWLLLTPGRVRVGRVVAYLLTLGLAYLLAGIAIALGADWLFDQFAGFFSGVSEITANFIWLGVGIALTFIALIVLLRKNRRVGESKSFGKIARWRDQAMSNQKSVFSVVSLALIAFTVEIATVVPYLAAIGLLTRAEITWPTTILWLAVYCLVMILPAAGLTTLRVFSHERVEPFLKRLSDWIGRHGAAMAGFFLGAVGLLLVVDAAIRLLQ